jgi:acetoacetyl-CoA synthetase
MDAPVWTPKHPQASRLAQFMDFVTKKRVQTFADYPAFHAWSTSDIVAFWQDLCDFFQIRFDTPASEVLNTHEHMLDARWFRGARLNFAQQLLSRDDDKLALIGLDELNRRQVFTYKELKQQVAQCAAGLKKAGVQSGDRVVAVMPNIAQTIIAMLATASLGAIWSSCSPDFGAQAIIDRFSQIEPVLLFVCDGHVYQGKRYDATEKIQQLSAQLSSLKNIVIVPFLNEAQTSAAKTMLWENFLQASTDLSFQSLPFDHPLYILFSSGTTGKPKCIIHSAGGTLLQHIKELALHVDLQAEDKLCFYTTCGWMMWNWMVSSLSLGISLVLYEGSPNFPDESCLFKLIDDEKITVFGTSAKFISSIEKANYHPNEHFSFKNLRSILSTGSPLLPKNYDFVYASIKKDVQLSSLSGGTDIVSCFALGNPIMPIYRGELQCLGLGMAVAIFNEQAQAVKEERGELVCTKAFPSMPIGFWADADKSLYRRTYFERFPGIWTHGDFAELTKHEGLIIYGRSDTTLNPGGVRIGTAEIYRQVEKITEVVDSVVIGQDWQDDVRIILFVKLQQGQHLTEALQNTLRQTIRKNASPRHVPAKILEVDTIPYTHNGKKIELAVRQVVHGQTVGNLSAIANPESLDGFKARLELDS